MGSHDGIGDFIGREMREMISLCHVRREQANQEESPHKQPNQPAPGQTVPPESKH